MFEPSEDTTDKDALEIFPKEAEPITLQLEEELTHLKAQVRSSNEQFEMQTEELKASNEELQAMNEELRSAAEELETSKEELQSINEELITVNQELKVKIEEVSQSNNDLENLINSTNIGTVFLDRYFRVKLFTPAVREMFNLIPADIGRPLSDITNRLEYANLLHDAEQVLINLHSIEREVTVKDGFTYLMQLSPYRTSEDRINGVVISFVNVSQLKHTEQALIASQNSLAGELEKMRNLYNSSTHVLGIHDIETALTETLKSTMYLLNADFGNIQLYNKETNSLKIVTQTGFSQQFVDFFKEVTADDDTSCGRSIRLRKRVIIPDIYKDEAFTPYVSIAVKEGYRAVQSTPFYNHDGGLLGVLSTHFKQPHIPADEDLLTLDLYVRQISAFISRIKAEEALRESEERLRIAMETAVDYAFIILNTDGLIEGWNSGAELFFEYKTHEVLGKPGAIIFTEEDKQAGIPEKEMRQAKEEGRATDERWHQRKDGSKFFMSGVMRPLYNGNLIGYLKVARDVTKQKLLEQQKDEFIAIASHELKTPVTSIKVYSELLRETLDKKDHTEEAQLIVKMDEQIDRLIELIHSLLDTTKIAEGHLTLSYEDFDLAKLAAEKVEEMQRISTKHTLKLVGDKKVFVKADKQRIEEVLINLLSNAIKYSPNGGDVIVAIEKKSDTVEVSVKDNGIGIPEYAQSKLFERFFRMKTKQVETSPGMGLGLYISSEIIKQHNGKMWIESKLNEGSTFYFSLFL